MAEKHEGYESVGCLEKDIRNHLDKDDRLTLELEDADAMLQCFMLIQEENPRFFFLKYQKIHFPLHTSISLVLMKLFSFRVTELHSRNCSRDYNKILIIWGNWQRKCFVYSRCKRWKQDCKGT